MMVGSGRLAVVVCPPIFQLRAVDWRNQSKRGELLGDVMASMPMN